MDKHFLAILACPQCKSKLVLHQGELICRADRLAYPIREGTPIMLVQEARKLSLEELDQIPR